ncbi:MAG: flagellar biosynthesis protein FlhF [Acidobacteria bacterium]|nr:flagellar biosynthesis protein FlhF [Acidobacteriota bacterium]
MMNIKKYRATTTREALEKIKNDLGENALVLETRQVRTGGFLGLGSGIQIEVSAAAPENLLNAKPAPQKKSDVHSNRILNLTDESVAAPPVFNPVNSTRHNIMAALSARATGTNGFEKEAPKTARILKSDEIAFSPKIEAVEISPEAPRVVHPRRELPKSNLTAAETPAAPVEPGPGGYTNRELELLRAELREIKFSVNSMTGRQTNNFWQKDVNFDLLDEIFESPFYETYMELTEAGVSAELARSFISDIIPQFRDKNLDPARLSETTLFRAISSTVKFTPDFLRLEKPTVMALIGATGVGKTTTIAKLAARAALQEHRRVELVTLDTYRIAAVEQLKTYAEIIGAGCHVVRSVLELDSVLRRLSPDAIVLIDTTGKNPHDLADQYELSDYLRQRPEIRKCLAVQATTHPLDAVAGIRKFEMYGADSLILTKLDETLRPGAILEVIGDCAQPVAYLCNGQRVPEDMQTATPETLTNRILGNY